VTGRERALRPELQAVEPELGSEAQQVVGGVAVRRAAAGVLLGRRRERGVVDPEQQPAR